MEREVDEDRTEKLESALKIIWRNINPSDPAFNTTHSLTNIGSILGAGAVGDCISEAFKLTRSSYREALAD